MLIGLRYGMSQVGPRLRRLRVVGLPPTLLFPPASISQRPMPTTQHQTHALSRRLKGDRNVSRQVNEGPLSLIAAGRSPVGSFGFLFS